MNNIQPKIVLQLIFLLLLLFPPQHDALRKCHVHHLPTRHSSEYPQNRPAGFVFISPIIKLGQSFISNKKKQSNFVFALSSVLHDNEFSVHEPIHNNNNDKKFNSKNQNIQKEGEKIILWRGEDTEGYSLELRQVEFENALQAFLLSQEEKDGSTTEKDNSRFITTRPTILPSNQYPIVSLPLQFVNALSQQFTSFSINKDGKDTKSSYHRHAFEGAMQYVQMIVDSHGEPNLYQEPTKDKGETHVLKNAVPLPRELLTATTQRCSLIRSSFEVVAMGETYEDLAKDALQRHLLDDMMIRNQDSEEESDSGTYKKNHNLNSKNNSKNSIKVGPSWCLRLRQYGMFSDDPEKSKRYGKRVKSPLTKEREAVEQMYHLFMLFTGPVQLKNPDCSLYVFEGITVVPHSTTTSTHHHSSLVPSDSSPSLFSSSPSSSSSSSSSSPIKVLVRLLAHGPETSNIAPKTRICRTNTPLCPVASYVMCNVAQIRQGQSILDPYAGSCAILLAASQLVGTRIDTPLRLVGIDIAHNGIINREQIREDFISRDLQPPILLMEGDSSLLAIRQEASQAIGNVPFDAIITDPPYGIREAMKVPFVSKNNGMDQNDPDNTILHEPFDSSHNHDQEQGQEQDEEGQDGNQPTTTIFQNPDSKDSTTDEINATSMVSPLDHLVEWIAHDKEQGKRLLKCGGVVVAFIPVLGDHIDISSKEGRSYLPNDSLLQRAGLQLRVLKKQRLNDVLSRWLVAYDCIT